MHINLNGGFNILADQSLALVVGNFMCASISNPDHGVTGLKVFRDTGVREPCIRSGEGHENPVGQRHRG